MVRMSGDGCGEGNGEQPQCEARSRHVEAAIDGAHAHHGGLVGADCASPAGDTMRKRRKNSDSDSPSRTTGPKINRKEGGGRNEPARSEPDPHPVAGSRYLVSLLARMGDS